MTPTIRHVVIHGRVQGVGFRAFVEDTAERLGLEGWVRNRRDGTVEALFVASEELVAQAIEACRRGPSAAHVTKLDVADAAGLLDDLRQRERFAVLPTT
jgi:acylphosphatase